MGPRPVRSFVVPLEPGATRVRKRVPTALQEHRPERESLPGFYSSATPGLMHFKHSVTQAEHRETTPAAYVLPEFLLIYIQSVTSLGGFILRLDVVCARLPPGHSFHHSSSQPLTGGEGR